MRRKPQPDNRLNWRDPDMPVLGRSGKPYPPEKMQAVRQQNLFMSPEPIYKEDPTYNLKKKKKDRGI